MGRIIGGAVLALWGFAATIYGLTRQHEGGAYGAGQITGVVVAACMCIGGISLVVSGIASANGSSAGRGRRSRGRDDDWDRGTRRRVRHTPDGDVSMMVVFLVVGALGFWCCSRSRACSF
jgi:hypothetical protein